jgi:hypothetical protein
MSRTADARPCGRPVPQRTWPCDVRSAWLCRVAGGNTKATQVRLREASNTRVTRTERHFLAHGGTPAKVLAESHDKQYVLVSEPSSSRNRRPRSRGKTFLQAGAQTACDVVDDEASALVAQLTDLRLQDIVAWYVAPRS